MVASVRQTAWQGSCLMERTWSLHVQGGLMLRGKLPVEDVRWCLLSWKASLCMKHLRGRWVGRCCAEPYSLVSTSHSRCNLHVKSPTSGLQPTAGCKSLPCCRRDASFTGCSDHKKHRCSKHICAAQAYGPHLALTVPPPAYPSAPLPHGCKREVTASPVSRGCLAAKGGGHLVDGPKEAGAGAGLCPPPPKAPGRRVAQAALHLSAAAWPAEHRREA